ncbi:MAG TPA: S53 family peptidase [Dokdonella sp.]|nr:S53 family peptidase [Dokdonella sp.]
MDGTLFARIGKVLVLAALAATDTLAHAGEVDLVKSTVDGAKRVTIDGARPAWARTERARGAVDAELRLGRVSVLLRRTPDRQAAFEALLRDQQDPRSPRYHQWLDAADIGRRYGASAHDLDALSSWLRSEGLRVEAVAPARTRVVVSGRSGDLARAFDTALSWYDGGERRRIGAKSRPSVPAAFAPIVRGVVGLDTFTLRPKHHVVAARRPAGAKALRPEGTACNDSGCEHVMFPADFAAIYGIGGAVADIDGAGQSIAIVGRQRVYAPDVSNYQTIAKLPQRAVEVIVPPGATDPGAPASQCGAAGSSCDDPSDAVGDQTEATLDVQVAAGVAPGATIKLIVAKDTDTDSGVQRAIEHAIDASPLPARVLSISFGSCEADNGADVARYLDDLFGQAAAEGISVFVSSGDSGVADCADHTGAPPAQPQPSIDVMCSSGHVTCVGGTRFADDAEPDRYWSSEDGYGYRSAYGYIPEGAWNEPFGRSGETALAASGGGTSVYLPRPAWQSGPGVPAANGRSVPDVSLNAAAHDGYFTCMAARRGSCAVSGGSFSFLISSGTSASAPAMAGIAARLNQKLGAAQGNLNPSLYALGAHAVNAVFHDVTPATSAVSPCDVAVPSPCNNSTPGPDALSGGRAGYAVAEGYDLATGLGSVDVRNLMAAWPTAQQAGPALNQHGMSGSWANAATPGQGLVIDVLPDLYAQGTGLLFGGWFTYGVDPASETPFVVHRWYTIQGQVDDGSVATMPVYATTGGRFDTSQPTSTDVVGTATLAFSDCSHGTLHYSISDFHPVDGDIPLTRLLPNVDCVAAGSPPIVPPIYWMSGTWADPANSGQGLIVDVGPTQNVVFAAWYTFAADGGQRWYTLQGTRGSNATRVDDIGIFETSIGGFDDATPVTTTRIGSASMLLAGCSSARLSYRFTGGENTGRSGTLELARLGTAAPGCHL